jgi:hypothetical protein
MGPDRGPVRESGGRPVRGPDRRPDRGSGSAGVAPEFFEKQSWFRNPIIGVLLPIETLFTIGIVSVLVGFSGRSVPVWVFPLIVVGGTAPLVVLARLPLRTIVEGTDLFVGFAAPRRRRIDLARVTECEAIRYSPLTDCGGWGLKASRRFGMVLNVAGDRGVRLVYMNDAGKEKRLLIGSQRADELASAIERARPS